MPRSYPHGKVPSSIATVISERFERPMVDCGYCSGQMCLRSARSGIGVEGKVEGHRIRAAGGRAHWAGNTASELRLGAKKAYNVDLLGIHRDSVLARVRTGFAVAVSLTYRLLPDYLKVQRNDFGHCVMVKGHRVEGDVTFVGVFDPLWEQGSQGTWAEWADLEKALWETGHSTTTVKYVPPTRRYTVHIAKDATVRAYPNMRKPASKTGPSCIERNRDGSYGTDTVWSRAGSHADCMVPVFRRTCDGDSSATTTFVTSGAFKDQHIRVGSAYGVTVTMKEG